MPVARELSSSYTAVLLLLISFVSVDGIINADCPCRAVVVVRLRANISIVG